MNYIASYPVIISIGFSYKSMAHKQINTMLFKKKGGKDGYYSAF